MSDLQLIITTALLTIILIFIGQYLFNLLRNNLKHIQLSDDNLTTKNAKIYNKQQEADHNKKYNELVEMIDEYEQHQENNQQKTQIAQLKQNMKNMLSNSNSYEQRVVITTYFIENIFNVLNNKKTITFKEFYNILSRQIYSSKSVDPAFKTYVKNNKNSINL